MKNNNQSLTVIVAKFQMAKPTFFTPYKIICSVKNHKLHSTKNGERRKRQRRAASALQLLEHFGDKIFCIFVFAMVTRINPNRVFKIRGIHVKIIKYIWHEEILTCEILHRFILTWLLFTLSHIRREDREALENCVTRLKYFDSCCLSGLIGCSYCSSLHLS